MVTCTSPNLHALASTTQSQMLLRARLGEIEVLVLHWATASVAAGPGTDCLEVDSAVMYTDCTNQSCQTHFEPPPPTSLSSAKFEIQDPWGGSWKGGLGPAVRARSMGGVLDPRGGSWTQGGGLGLSDGRTRPDGEASPSDLYSCIYRNTFYLYRKVHTPDDHDNVRET